MDDFESPEVQKDFPGLYTPGPSKNKKEEAECKLETTSSVYLLMSCSGNLQFRRIKRRRIKRRTRDMPRWLATRALRTKTEIRSKYP